MGEWSTLATIIDGSGPYLGWSCVKSGHFWGWIVQKPKIIRHSVFPIQFCQTTFGRRLFWGRAIRILTILSAQENFQRNVQIENSRTVQLIRKSAGWGNAGFPKDGLWWMKSWWWHQTSNRFHSFIHYQPSSSLLLSTYTSPGEEIVGYRILNSRRLNDSRRSCEVSYQKSCRRSNEHYLTSSDSHSHTQPSNQ